MLYEAAELEHTLMCTYLYAAFGLKRGVEEGLSPGEATAVEAFRATIMRVAVEEMAHLTAVWNITAALGGAPRFGRGNFPLDPGALPARLVVKLAPFDEASLQHFIHLERPEGSNEPEGSGFEPTLLFERNSSRVRLVPMAVDYETVGTFYGCLGSSLRAFVDHHGERLAFSGDPALQISSEDMELAVAEPVICSKTALSAFAAIVEQGEGAPEHQGDSHFRRYRALQAELRARRAANSDFSPTHPVARNPVLRRPMRSEDRVWIENEEAWDTVDLANAGYALMLRLLAYSYVVPRPLPEKTLVLDLSLGLMRAVAALGERAARLPAGPSHPGVNAGMSFTALRDAAPLPRGASAWRFFGERLAEMANAARGLGPERDPRLARAARILGDLEQRARRGLALTADSRPAPASSPPPGRPPSTPPPGAPTPAPEAPVTPATHGTQASAPLVPPVPVRVGGVDQIEGRQLTLLYEGKKCIHSRFCVTGAPRVFLANVPGPWIVPDAVDVETLVGIAHACPSGAIRYRRKDGHPDEAPPPVNLVATREAGPYAFRGDLRIDGESRGHRATLCRCGASKNKPYCDGSHHDAGFAATGEPPTGEKTAMLEVRDGPLAVNPEIDGPLVVRGNLEITSGTGRVVARVSRARLCRCGGSATKPFCDGTHARIGFRSS